MTPEGIRSAIMSHVDASFSTAIIDVDNIVYPNFNYKPKGDIWLRVAVTMGSTFEAEKGSDGVGLRMGHFSASFFVPVNDGTSNGLTNAGLMESIFRKKEIDTIMFGEPYTRELGLENEYYHIMTTVPFHAWVGE